MEVVEMGKRGETEKGRKRLNRPTELVRIEGNLTRSHKKSLGRSEGP